MTTVKNCMEDFVFERIDMVLKEQPHLCNCEQCKSDIALLALNNLKPYYVSTDRGDTFTRLALYEKESEINILCAVAEALKVVSANPRHEK